MRRPQVVRMGGMLAGLFLIVGILPAHADPVPGGMGIRLVDAPVDAHDDPRAQLAVVDDLTPGAVIKRRIEVSNGTDAVMAVHLYATGADIADGSFVGHEDGSRDEIAAWTTVDHDTVTLQPGESSMPVVQIAVPADVTGGERYGVVWAETTTAGTAGGIVQKSRVGIRLYVAVNSGHPPPTAFVVTDLTASRASDGLAAVTARVSNTGGRAIDLNGSVTLTDGPGATSAGPFPAAVIRTIAPGQVQTVSFALPAGLPNGPWTTTVDLTSGLVTETATAVLTFPDIGAAAPVTVERAGGSGLSDAVLPVTGLFLALVLGAAVMMVVRHRRRAAAG